MWSLPDWTTLPEFAVQVRQISSVTVPSGFLVIDGIRSGSSDEVSIRTASSGRLTRLYGCPFGISSSQTSQHRAESLSICYSQIQYFMYHWFFAFYSAFSKNAQSTGAIGLSTTCHTLRT